MTAEITISYSEVKDMRRCAFKHDLGWRRGYRRKHAELCDCALCFGIAWHNVMQAYYDGMAGRYDFPATTTDYRYTQAKRGAWHAGKHMLATGVPEHLQKRIEWMLEGYAAHYGAETGWTVVATEYEIIVPLPQLYEDLIVNLKARIDLVIRDPNDKLWVDDHKTCSQLPSKNRQVDPQLPLYCYAIKEGSSWPTPFGARYSYALKPPKTMQFKKQRTLDERFRRRRVPHTDKEIYNAARDCYISTYTRYKEAELFPKPARNVTPDCSWDCDFEKPCAASRKGYDTKKFLADLNIDSRRVDEPKAPKEPES